MYSTRLFLSVANSITMEHPLTSSCQLNMSSKDSQNEGIYLRSRSLHRWHSPSLMLATPIGTKFQMYSVPLFAWSPSKIFNSYPLNLYDCSSSILKPTRYHHDHNENEGGHAGPKNLRDDSASILPWCARVGMVTVPSGA